MKINQKGLTLIEMMIAIVIGLIMTSAVMTMFISNIRSNSDSVAMIRLNQELRGVMNFVSDELKRAGYSADPSEDAFMDELSFSGNCFRYSYDENGDGDQDTNERFGFKGVDTDSDSNIDTIRWSNNNTSAILTDCTTGSWEGITEIEIANIESVTVVPVNIIAGTVTIKQMTITITATTELSGGTIASRTISEIIRVRNDAL